MIFNLIIVLSVVLGSVCGPAPIPHCSLNQVISQAPLSEGQKIQVSLDPMFSGYNLNISVSSNSSSFSQLNRKIQLIDQNNQQRWTNVISHYVEHNGNDWGKEAYLLYNDQNGSTILNIESIKRQTQVPSLNFSVVLTTDRNVRCFGAALLLDFNLAIVDCVHRNQSAEILFQNYFYYVNLTSQELSRKVKNAMVVNYKQITRRKIFKFKDATSGYEYFLRVHLADGVNIQQRGNTFMQIFSIRDPYDIQIMKLIDRTLLDIPALSIMDAQVYLGDIFFLDYNQGLYRLDILKNIYVIVTGRYVAEGFTRFAVYSDDLEDQVLIALANAHAVYQIDWSNMRNPTIVNKYSLMEHSHIRTLLINDLFVIVQSAANASNSTIPNFEVDYTWIFSKGSRTYTNAYAIINHRSNRVDLQFNKANDRLLLIQQRGFTLYEVNQPILTLQIARPKQLGTFQDLVLIASSSDPNVRYPVLCQGQIRIYFVKNQDMTIYKENFINTEKYSINYPGQLTIPLDRYVMGPNISYSLVNTSNPQKLPAHWTNKLNRTRVIINESIGDVLFFRTEVVRDIGKDIIIYYAQNTQFATYFIQCQHTKENDVTNCTVANKANHQSQITSFTTAGFKNTEAYTHYYFMVFKQNPKTVQIINYFYHTSVKNITYIGQQDAEVTDIATSNGYLYILRGVVKTIDVYILSECYSRFGECKLHFRIDVFTMKSKGVDYFGPQKLITDQNHPQVLFIKCKGSIIILDVDNRQNILLLDQIISPATLNSFYRVAVNKRRLVIVSDPNIIDVYTLDHLYIANQVKFIRSLPLHGHVIQNSGDIQFSDLDTVIYINAVDPNRSASTILVYQTDKPAAASLYTAIPLRKIYVRPELQIQVSGYEVDYLNIKTDDGFMVYKVFSHPQYVIQNVFPEFAGNIEFTNSRYTIVSNYLQIKTVNMPSGFNSTSQLNKTVNNLKLNHHGNYSWFDFKWFVGQILSYNFSCDECGDNSTQKVQLKQHVDPLRSLNFVSKDYSETLTGGVSIVEDLFRWRINGSIHNVINLPDQKYREQCKKVATTFHTQLIASVCTVPGEVANIYLTTQTSDKGWTWGPYRSNSYYANKLQIAGDILALTDTSPYPEYKLSKGSIFLYSLELDYISEEPMDELEVIDENDLLMASGYKKNSVYMGSSELVYSPVNNWYRLYVTDVDSGLFVVDFSHQLGRREINVMNVNFINIEDLLEEHGEHMPDDAIFLSVSFCAYKYMPIFYSQTVVVTTKNYHNLQVMIIYDDNGKVVKSILHRIYYRYAYYMATGLVKSAVGYVAINYIIPGEQQFSTNYTRQLVAVYDSRDYELDHEKGYSQRYMLGAVRHDKAHTGLLFSFNTTYDERSNGTRVGLVVCDQDLRNNEGMRQLSVSRLLALELKPGFKTQTFTFIPFSDFQVKSFSIQIVKEQSQEDKENFVLTIIIIGLAVGVTLGFAIYIIILVRKNKKQPEDRISLLTQDENIRASSNDYRPPSASEIKKTEGQQQKKAEQQQDDDEEQEQQDEQQQHKEQDEKKKTQEKQKIQKKEKKEKLKIIDENVQQEKKDSSKEENISS